MPPDARPVPISGTGYYMGAFPGPMLIRAARSRHDRYDIIM